MLAQVIFFLALALFIVLLARRLGRVPDFTGQAGRIAQRFGKNALSSSLKLGRDLVDQAKRASGFLPGPSPVGKPGQKSPFQAGGHTFWQEEGAGKMEIPSYFEEGDNLFRQAKYQEAEQFFLKAATSKPDDPRIYGRLGVIYLNNKNYTDAIESLKVAVKLDKYNPSRHFNLALAHWGNKDKQRAIASVREAISLDPITPRYRQFLETLLGTRE